MTTSKKPRKITAQIRKKEFEEAVQILEHRLSKAYLQGWDDGSSNWERYISSFEAPSRPKRIVNRVAPVGLITPMNIGGKEVGGIAALAAAMRAVDWSLVHTRFKKLEYTPRFAQPLFSPEVIEENRESNPFLPNEVTVKRQAEWTPSVHGESFRFDPTKHWTEHNAVPEEPSVRAWLENEKNKKDGI